MLKQKVFYKGIGILKSPRFTICTRTSCFTNFNSGPDAIKMASGSKTTREVPLYGGPRGQCGFWESRRRSRETFHITNTLDIHAPPTLPPTLTCSARNLLPTMHSELLVATQLSRGFVRHPSGKACYLSGGDGVKFDLKEVLGRSRALLQDVCA